MDLIEPLKPITYIQLLYHTLRECRPNYNANDYKWRLGTAVIAAFERQYNNFNNALAINREALSSLRDLYNTDEKRKLYGIDVEIDYCNPYNLQLFEDITNKIAVDEKGDI